MSELDKVISKLNGQYKEELIKKGVEIAYNERIPFSSPRLNYMTYGGVPLGKSTELFGPENGGKTTTALDVVGNAQKLAHAQWNATLSEMRKELRALKEKAIKSVQKRIDALTAEIDEFKKVGPRKVVYIDAENTLDVEWAELQGVDTSELYLVRPQDHTAEQVFQMVLDLVASGEIICIVLDSIPALVSQKLYEKSMEEKTYAGISDAAADFSRKVSPLISKFKTAYVQINQIRDNLKNPFDIYHTPAGRALKHLHALRLYISKGKFIDESNNELSGKAATEPAGNIVDVAMIKTKICKPDRRVGFYTLNYQAGIDVLSDTLDMAVKYGYVALTGAWHTFINIETGEVITDKEGKHCKVQGRAAAIKLLREDAELFAELSKAIHEKVTFVV